MINKIGNFSLYLKSINKSILSSSLKVCFSLLAFSLFLFTSCSESPPTEEKQVDTSSSFQTGAPAGLTPANTSPAAATAGSSGVAHFVCPNKCAGSGGAIQTSCPICGTAYVHNQEYHNQPGFNEKATPELIPMNAPGGQPAAPTSQSQNAAGVWHFTCTAGCEGGSGNKGICAKCGQDLVHNQAYHQ